MLELSKTILSKISFDKYLFKKELQKALNWLKPTETVLLKVWCLANFGHIYNDVILDAFDTK